MNFEEIFFSAGASTENEIKKAVQVLEKGKSEYILMHCVSAYPCDDDRINLNRINWLKGLNKRVGFSDHSQSTVVPALAIPLGIEVIEKHFTTDHNLPGRDNKFALEPDQFFEMVTNIRKSFISKRRLEP